MSEMNEKFGSLTDLVPPAGKTEVDWDLVLQSELNPYFHKMAQTWQNPEWHGEGDVWTHTKMVCASLIKLRAWQELDRQRQEALFIAALLHDIGKVVCTCREDGRLVSPNHTSVGERMARAVLWRDFGLCGTYGGQQFRETVCALIRCHSIPFHFYHEKEPERRVITLAAKGELAAWFSNELLCLLAEADMRGRLSKDTDERLEHLYFFREAAEESGCLKRPREFPSSFSRYAYLSGRNILPGQELYDDTWGTVVMAAGLPGTGKDTYLKKNFAGLPMVSLDALRKEMNISPKEQQGKIVQAAREQAKDYLRKRQPFVWNATDLTPVIREKQIKLFMDYKAAVKIVYLEAPWEVMLERNRNRQEAVPEVVIAKMLEKLVLPDVREAQEVKWVLNW